MCCSGEGDFVEAHEIATQGKNAFPNSNGGKLCHNLVQQIEAKSLQVATERVWNEPLADDRSALPERRRRSTSGPSKWIGPSG